MLIVSCKGALLLCIVKYKINNKQLQMCSPFMHILSISIKMQFGQLVSVMNELYQVQHHATYCQFYLEESSVRLVGLFDKCQQFTPETVLASLI